MDAGPADARVELMERSEQLSALGRALDKVVPRRAGAIVLVAGEAGVGKTALLRELCARRRDPARVLWGACEPLSRRLRTS